RRRRCGRGARAGARHGSDPAGAPGHVAPRLPTHRSETQLTAAVESAGLQEVLVMSGSVIVGGARTPIGKLSGALKDFSAMDLGGIAIKEAMSRAWITGDQVDYVIMGHVIQAGAGQITARQAAVKGGVPMTVAALTVNK